LVDAKIFGGGLRVRDSDSRRSKWLSHDGLRFVGRLVPLPRSPSECTLSSRACISGSLTSRGISEVKLRPNWRIISPSNGTLQRPTRVDDAAEACDGPRGVTRGPVSPVPARGRDESRPLGESGAVKNIWKESELLHIQILHRRPSCMTLIRRDGGSFSLKKPPA
jgi:hypothetical protein